jgi:RNA polymerase sigma-70 factor (ECF subfamily)
MTDATVTDEVLMLAVRDGDLASLGQLFERYHVALFGFLSRMTGDRSAAEDLVQDVFVRVLKYRGTYREGGSFETWLFRIARNARADHFRKRKPVESVPDEQLDGPSSAAGPAHQLERQREVNRLKRALLMLREDKRELIVLARYQGMRHEAIAELLGVDTGAVKVRIHRAMKELREIFLGMSERPSCDVKTSPHSLPII